VQDADALYARATQNGARIGETLESKPWGMREFMVETPDGHRLRIGHGEKRVDQIEKFSIVSRDGNSS
jgi:uncharacterized glyoxalase superfamily protein PhnB